MLLEALNYHSNDSLGCRIVHRLSNAHHDHLHETTQHELNLHDLSVPLVGAFNSHAELLKDHA